MNANFSISATIHCSKCTAQRTYADCPPDFGKMLPAEQFAEDATDYFKTLGWQLVVGRFEQPVWECPAHAMLEKEAA